MRPSLQTQVVFSNNCIRIEVDVTAGIIFVEWLRHPSSLEFRRLYQKASDISFEYNCLYWISDARAVHYLEIADQNWILRELAPRLKTTSLLRYARVMTEDGVAMLDAARVRDNVMNSPYLTEGKFQVQFFLDKESALEWLLSEREADRNPYHRKELLSE